MSTEDSDLLARIAARVSAERADRGWSLATLADRAGVSKAMISKIERAEVSATAVVLGRLAGAFDVNLSALLVGAPDPSQRVSRAGRQPSWSDPATGYRRTLLSPDLGGPLELVRVELPPGARVPFPADSYRAAHHVVWVLEGRLAFAEGAVVHRLEAGDCLSLGPPTDCAFENESDAPVRYLVVLGRRA